MKINLRLFAIVMLCFTGGGCGPIFYLSETQAHKDARKDGYELCHLRSCGPQALSDAFRFLGISKKPLEIGKEIQDDDRSHYRSILSAIDHRFASITCPPELLKFCKKYKIKIKKTDSLDGLTQADVAIALIKGPDDLEDWHWMAYPTFGKLDILSFFDHNTKLKAVYVLSNPSRKANHDFN